MARGKFSRRTPTELSPKEQIFVEAYTDPDSPTALNATQSYRKAYESSQAVAHGNSSNLAKRPAVRMAIQEILGSRHIDAKVADNIERLVDAAKKAPTSDWKAQKLGLEASHFIKDVFGWKQPDQHLHMNMPPADREQEYEKIVQLVRKTEIQNKPLPKKPKDEEEPPSAA